MVDLGSRPYEGAKCINAFICHKEIVVNFKMAQVTTLCARQQAFSKRGRAIFANSVLEDFEPFESVVT